MAGSRNQQNEIKNQKTEPSSNAQHNTTQGGTRTGSWNVFDINVVTKDVLPTPSVQNKRVRLIGLSLGRGAPWRENGVRPYRLPPPRSALGSSAFLLQTRLQGGSRWSTHQQHESRSIWISGDPLPTSHPTQIGVKYGEIHPTRSV
jgi:hypothetical protein